MRDANYLNQSGLGKLPGYLGLKILDVSGQEVRAELAVREELMAPNGFLHAGSIITLADTACGYGCLNNLPEGATSFTTIEIKSNHLGTTASGMLDCVATAVHLGRSTHVWDAVVTHRERGKTLALFRCTQMILYAK